MCSCAPLLMILSEIEDYFSYCKHF